MKVPQNELFKLKDEYKKKFVNKEYRIYAHGCYAGKALVCAENAEAANKYIEAFKKEDSSNKSDSWGYERVSEDDYTRNVSDKSGITNYGIYYQG